MAEVCVLGLGYVGLPTASVLANAGFNVLGVDVDRELVEGLKSGRTRLKEAGLATLLTAAIQSGNLVPRTAPEPSDTFLICVPTPIEPGGASDLKAVESAARSIVPHLRKGNLVVLESTVPVGVTRGLVGKILAETGLKPGEDFDLCYCPERVLPGNTSAELVNNDRIIGGVTPASAERAHRIYQRFCQGQIYLTDDRTAELCKLMENTYRDVNVALANTFGRVAEEAGIDVWKAIELANRHPRVKILRPGPGTGGHCIPVDPWFLVEAYPGQTGLLRSAREVNDSQPERLLDRMAATGKLKSGGKLAVLGAAYKADIDDARETPTRRLAEAARKKGIQASIHDPLVPAGDHEGVAVTNDLAACLKGADAAVLMTEHKAYRSLSGRSFAEHMKGRLIADARNWLNHESLRLAGFTVIVLGDGSVR